MKMEVFYLPRYVCLGGSLENSKDFNVKIKELKAFLVTDKASDMVFLCS